MPDIELFDTHCHTHELVERITPIYDKWHADNANRTVESVLSAASQDGVTRSLLIGTSYADSLLATKVAAAHNNVGTAIGIHPHEADKHEAINVQKKFSSLLGSENAKHIKAIGECGLDYFYTYSPKESQIALLRFQIELALQHNLPISFHVREAFDDFWPIFDSYHGSNIRGVLHSFTDSALNMEQAIKRGLLFGVNGIATFAKNEDQLVIYRTIPQQSLLLETDAPLLTPHPFRGKVCESKHVRVTAEFLADLRGERLEDLAAYTTANARALFAI